jgi:hypothetical protein
MTPSQLIAMLNALSVGEVGSLKGKLEEARLVCRELGYHELADKLGEAQAALRQADLKTYRKRVETVVARLGHLR